jgi:hypothetical protein
MIDQSIRRPEDLRLLCGQGRCAGDIRLAGMLEAVDRPKAAGQEEQQ